MEKITNYLELIQQIQDITPEKEAFCTTGRSLTYSQLYALAKEKQGMLKQEKKKLILFAINMVKKYMFR